MKKVFLTTIICIWISGTALHYLFEISGNNNIVALFAPINESVWEHYKLLLFPVMAGILFLSFKWGASWQSIGAALVASVLIGAFIMFGIFYIYTSALGIGPILIIDMGSFFVSSAVALGLGASILKLNVPTLVGVLCWCAVMVIIAAVCSFSYYPPRCPIFKEWQK